MSASGWLAVSTLIDGIAWLVSDLWWRRDMESEARWRTTTTVWFLFLAHCFALPGLVLFEVAS